MRKHAWIWISLVTVVAVVAGVVGWIGHSAQHAVDKATGNKGGSVIDALRPKPLAGETTGSINILLAGNSYDDPGHGGADLTDSIMVAHLDLKADRVTLVSVPRDLQVDYNGQQMKINAVYVVAGEGMAGLDALSTVVQDITGLQINQRVLVGYNGLRDAVNEVGGIDVTIASSDPRGIYDPTADNLRITNGTHHIDGQTALDLCRARNDTSSVGRAYGLPNGDFDREKLQRMVLTALITKLKNSSALANPVTLVKMFDTISQNVTTDLTVSQIAHLGSLSSKLSGSGAIRGISVEGPSTAPLLVDSTSTSLGDTLLPAAGEGDYTAITKYVTEQINLP